jgi:hypothetical protein
VLPHSHGERPPSKSIQSPSKRFIRSMREQLVSGDVAARKAYLSSMDAVVASDSTIRI